MFEGPPAAAWIWAMRVSRGRCRSMMCEAPASCSSDVFDRLATATMVLTPRIRVARRVKRRAMLVPAPRRTMGSEAFSNGLRSHGAGKSKPKGVKRAIAVVQMLMGRVQASSSVILAGVCVIESVCRIAYSCSPAWSGVGYWRLLVPKTRSPTLKDGDGLGPSWWTMPAMLLPRTQGSFSPMKTPRSRP